MGLGGRPPRYNPGGHLKRRRSGMDRHDFRRKNRGRTCLLSCIPLILYLIIGAWIFNALELDNERAANEALNATKMELSVILSKAPANISDAELEIVRAYVAGDDCSQPVREKQMNWHFSGSLFFAMTIVTTVGYGSFAPATYAGKAFTCVYAIFGIAYFGFILTLASDEVVYWTRLVIKNRAKNYFKKTHLTVKTLWVLGIMNFIFIFLVSLLGLLMSWKYADAFYFAVITFTTVGLGDFTPSFTAKESIAYQTAGYTAFGLGSLLGLAVLAAFVNGLGDYLETDMALPGLKPQRLARKLSRSLSSLSGKGRRKGDAPKNGGGDDDADEGGSKKAAIRPTSPMGGDLIPSDQADDLMSALPKSIVPPILQGPSLAKNIVLEEGEGSETKESEEEGGQHATP